MKPYLKSTILLSPVENGYVAYDTETDELHQLNPLASLIVDLSNGTRSVIQIEEAVSPLLPNNETTEIHSWINRAIESGLLITEGNRKTKNPELSAQQLIDLANKLRENGKIQTAFVCQKKATELAPHEADIWNDAGELAHIAGRREDARLAYERYLELVPNDAEVQHLLVALRNEEPPARVPDECITQLYERFSSFYDKNLVDELECKVPQRVREAIQAVVPNRSNLSILDMGCGTGLSGVELQPFAKTLTGIDLSSHMIEKAKNRNLYDHLEVAEITSWLEGKAQNNRISFDLIVACDTLIYFGDLHNVISLASKLLTEGGAIIISVEKSDHNEYRLTDSGRYAHHLKHLQSVAHSAGLNLNYHREEYLRMEYGEEVTGHIVVMSAQETLSLVS